MAYRIIRATAVGFVAGLLAGLAGNAIVALHETRTRTCNYHIVELPGWEPAVQPYRPYKLEVRHAR